MNGQLETKRFTTSNDYSVSREIRCNHPSGHEELFHAIRALSPFVPSKRALPPISLSSRSTFTGQIVQTRFGLPTSCRRVLNAGDEIIYHRTKTRGSSPRPGITLPRFARLVPTTGLRTRRGIETRGSIRHGSHPRLTCPAFTRPIGTRSCQRVFS